jgi:DNA-binding NarL/FixJ family response regulator
VIRVLIADDEAIARDGLRAIVEHEPDLEVVGEAADGAQVVAAARELQPDVALVDVQMPNVDGVEATRHLLALPRPPRVLSPRSTATSTSTSRCGRARAPSCSRTSDAAS